jgi:HPt (histidine-containing phosphotransfer) domain-containing protein
VRSVNGKKPAASVHLESDSDFQVKIQKMFYKNNTEKATEIKKAIDDKDIKLAHRLAHTLKGNAAQIGKKLLQHAAAEVEAHLKDGECHVTEDQMKMLQSELALVINELSSLFRDEEKEEPSPASFDPVKFREIYVSIMPLLKSGNPESLNYLEDLRAVEEYKTLCRQIEDFEFEKAIVTFEEIKKRTE